MLHHVVEKVSNRPRPLLVCRGILEGNFKMIRPVIAERLPGQDGRLVLDVACGPGAFSDMFRPENYCGVDLNERYVHMDRGRFYRMDARAIDFPGESFDNALIFGLLRHLDDEDVSGSSTLWRVC